MEQQKTNSPDTSVEVVDIQFRPGQKIYYFDPNGLTCKAGDHVIIDTARGDEYGTCTGGNHRIAQREVISPLRPVIRLANEQDEKIAAENAEKEKQAFALCSQRIEEYKLDMQLVSAEYSFDGTKLLFFFTADDRVDFRELVKSLAGTFHTRIELRQIGVRDKAKMVGGLGICGRSFCCSSFLDDFQPVSIKMAKTQNLSLNPTKISGTCGRLMCCLKYEQDAYEDLLRNSPKLESFVDTPEGRGTVTEVNLLRQRVKVQLEDRPESIMSFANDEIAVLRNGKAKKNDPPIPADLAPISGTHRAKPAADESFMTLEPIRFRDEKTEIAPAAPTQAETEDAPKPPRHNRRRRSARPKAQPTENAPEKSAPESAEKPKNIRRRHHRRRPKAPRTE